MLKQFLRDEEGQTTVEYLLSIAVIVVVISVLGKQMQQKVGTLVETIFSEVNRSVTGLMRGQVR